MHSHCRRSGSRELFVIGMQCRRSHHEVGDRIQEVEPRDIESLVTRIRHLAAHRDEAEAMGRRGRALYDARFAPAIALADWERILREAANE